MLRALREALPGADYIYLGDTARTPYGSKGQATVLRYARECADFLWHQNIDLLIVACNTASALALDTLQKQSPCPVIGTIEPAVKACLSRAGRGPVAVIGTSATIASGAYQRRLAELAPELEVLSQACPLFVPLVEEGFFSGEIAARVIEHYLSSLREKQPSAIILACTHYPLLSPGLSAFLGAQAALIDCAGAVAEEVLRLKGVPRRMGGKDSGSMDYYVTDQPARFNCLANLLLEGCEVRSIKIESL